MRNRNHALFRSVDAEDSCCVALAEANKKFLERQASREKEQSTEPCRYVAVDSDLPRIFWEPSELNPV
jgi:hypothetical protein